jgi:hypothetical protein
MKQKIIRAASVLFTMLVFQLLSIAALAQEKGLDVDINVKKESEWYQQPWVWVVGGAVFILLLAAILRGGRARSES